MEHLLSQLFLEEINPMLYFIWALYQDLLCFCFSPIVFDATIYLEMQSWTAK